VWQWREFLYGSSCTKLEIISASSRKWHKYLELDSSLILIIQILRTKAVNLIFQESNSWGNKNLKGRWIQLSKKIKTSWRFVAKAQPALSKSTAYLCFLTSHAKICWIVIRKILEVHGLSRSLTKGLDAFWSYMLNGSSTMHIEWNNPRLSMVK